MSRVTEEEVTEEQILSFDDGIPGFPECRRFVLVDVAEDSAFQYLQCLDDADVAMVVTVPWIFFPDYAPELTDIEQEELAIASSDDAVIFCPVTLDKTSESIFVNLLGPFVVNSRTRRGRQLVLADSEYPARAPVEIA